MRVERQKQTNMIDSAYTIAAIVGCGLIVASLLGVLDGDHSIDHHFGHDTFGHDGFGHVDSSSQDTNQGHEHSADWMSWIPLFSVRFWVFGSAAFGLIGVLLRILDTGSASTRLVAAVLGGLFTGTAVWSLFRFTKGLDRSDNASARQLWGQTAKVIVPIRGTDVGKIRLQVQGQTVELLAKSESGADLETGEEVFVVSMSGSFADVIPIDEVEKRRYMNQNETWD
jgi:membrane protein implicated in regulation of membrane protease activity